jgi:ribosomal protein L12E/L44/L45/RPP1/RPP2
MTQDDLTKLAKAAGFLVDGDSWIHSGAVLVDGRKSIDEQLKRFANLVAAAKAEVALAEAYRCGYKDGMEASAVICENLSVQQDKDVRDECAAAIRARSQA